MASLIGLIGNAGHGKDTIGDYLNEKYGFLTYAFALPLKKAIMSVFHLTREQMYDPVLKEVPDCFWGVTPRKLMQFIGTDLLRNQMGEVIPDLGKEIWLKSFQKWREAQRMADGTLPPIVVTDIRFPNEAEFIKSLGGEIWKVDRTGNMGETAPPASSYSHASEIELQTISTDHLVILNDGTIDDLYLKVDTVIQLFFPELADRDY